MDSYKNQKAKNRRPSFCDNGKPIIVKWWSYRTLKLSIASIPKHFLKQRNIIAYVLLFWIYSNWISCGVLKGSVLGPILFLICINDHPAPLDYCQCVLFANNTTLLANNSVSLIEEDLDRPKAWFWLNVNKLKRILE